jgi:hypothetical protein
MAIDPAAQKILAELEAKAADPSNPEAQDAALEELGKVRDNLNLCFMCGKKASVQCCDHYRCVTHLKWHLIHGDHGKPIQRQLTMFPEKASRKGKRKKARKDKQGELFGNPTCGNPEMTCSWCGTKIMESLHETHGICEACYATQMGLAKQRQHIGCRNCYQCVMCNERFEEGTICPQPDEDPRELCSSCIYF